MYMLPQEIEVWYIIPAIRKELAKNLVKTHKMSYEKAGRILGISKAAVCQYLGNKRANKFKLNPDMKKEIKKSSKIIVQDNNKAILEIERIIKYLRANHCPCELCKKYNLGVMEFCKGKPVC